MQLKLYPVQVLPRIAQEGIDHLNEKR